MISYTAAQMEQERNDPKWLVVNGVEPKIKGDLVIDVETACSHHEKVPAIRVNWETVVKYRLHNGPGYRDGIAIDEGVCKITEMKEQKADEWVDGLPPAGEVCEISPGKSDIWTEHLVIAYYGIHAWIVEAGSLDPGTCLVGGCKFRPIQTQRDKVMEYVLGIEGSFTWSKTEMLDELLKLGMLSMPEGDNND